MPGSSSAYSAALPLSPGCAAFVRMRSPLFLSLLGGGQRVALLVDGVGEVFVHRVRPPVRCRHELRDGRD